MAWLRSGRRSMRDRISHAHLLASSAIPFLFPATPLKIDGEIEYFGDGSMRQSPNHPPNPRSNAALFRCGCPSASLRSKHSVKRRMRLSEPPFLDFPKRSYFQLSRHAN